MKTAIKIFALALFISGVSTTFAFAQTKRKTTITKRRGARTTVKKTVTTTKKTMKDEKPAAITTTSGLIYQITERGTGAQIKAGDTVVANYTGLLTNGFKFDSSLDRGETFEFPVGAGRVIKGWDEGFQLLHVGDKAILTIPASIGYGERGRGVIPPNATLIFIVEVVGVK